MGVGEHFHSQSAFVEQVLVSGSSDVNFIARQIQNHTSHLGSILITNNSDNVVINEVANLCPPLTKASLLELLAIEEIIDLLLVSLLNVRIKGTIQLRRLNRWHWSLLSTHVLNRNSGLWHGIRLWNTRLLVHIRLLIALITIVVLSVWPLILLVCQSDKLS